MRQITKLARPFPANFVEKPPQGKYGGYVKHQNVNQALLAICGPFDWRIVQILERDGEVQGCIGELTVTVDDQKVTIQEVGDCEQPSNWKTNGARMKDASSDAFKRCCMRLGLGLHLWAEPKYVLYEQLKKQDAVGGRSDSQDEEDEGS